MSEPNSVVEPIEKSWHELTGLVESLGRDKLALRGADGWTVKDHLDHVAAWEKSLIALLDGSNRAAAMGIAASGDEGTDVINDAIWKMHREESPEQALAYFHDTHKELMRLLRKLSDADLQKPYNDYQPNDPRDPDDNRPALDWVAGNTWEHYAEHIEWISQLVNESSAER
jgi:hypothetical protein